MIMRNMMAAMVAFVILAAFAACQSDSYETGQGPNSLIQADFVEAHTSALGLVDRVETDEGHGFSLAQPQEMKWATTPDSLYRALFYYEKTNDSVAKTVSISQVPTLHPKQLKPEETLYTDPVKFESLWLSANGKYLNLGLYLKNGVAQSDSLHHTMGMVRKSETTDAVGKRTVCLCLYHNQGGVPEYYSSRYYVSVPCKEIDADSVVVTINTYNGAVERRLSLSNR